jgi:hypothetical protein
MAANSSKTVEILLCDARVDPPTLQIYQLPLPKEGLQTVGWALQTLQIAQTKDDPVIGRKGCKLIQKWHVARKLIEIKTVS